jgi:hypothetical protein
MSVQWPDDDVVIAPRAPGRLHGVHVVQIP